MTEISSSNECSSTVRVKKMQTCDIYVLHEQDWSNSSTNTNT